MEHRNYYLPIPVKMLWVVNGFSALNKIPVALLTGTSLVINKLKIGSFTVLPPTNWSVRSDVVSIDALFINQKDAIFGTILEANFMYNHQGRIHGKSPYLLETRIVGKSYGSFVTHSRSMGLLHIMRCQVLKNFQIQFHFILVIIYFMI